MDQTPCTCLQDAVQCFGTCHLLLLSVPSLPALLVVDPPLALCVPRAPPCTPLCCLELRSLRMLCGPVASVVLPEQLLLLFSCLQQIGFKIVHLGSFVCLPLNIYF